MPFYPTTSVTLREATATASIPSLNKVAVFSPHAFTKEFSMAFYSLEDLNNSSVSKYSDAYKALVSGFKDAGPRSLPIYLARVAMDDVTLTPTVADNETYSFKATVYDTTDMSTVLDAVEVSFTSDSDATGVEITTGILAAAGTAGITPTELLLTDNVSSITIEESANRQLVLSDLSENLVSTFTTTTSAAQAFDDFTSENPSDWYYATTTVRDNDWILDMADIIEATDNADYPKMFHVTSSAIDTLSVQTNPSNVNDLLGRLEDGNYELTTGEWHQDSNTDFPEVGHMCWVGSYPTGVKARAFSTQCKVSEARHPVLGRTLTKAEVGFITDRNAVVRFREMGIVLYKTGKLGTSARGQGQWAQNVTIAHWTRLTMQQRNLNLLVNQDTAGDPITFTKRRLEVVADTLNSVLSEGVDSGFFTGFIPVEVPESVAFDAQAMRTLEGLKFTAYLAGGVNFVLVDGVLTYSETVQ
ncbi:tail sheath [Vibrio phage F99]